MEQLTIPIENLAKLVNQNALIQDDNDLDANPPLIEKKLLAQANYLLGIYYKTKAETAQDVTNRTFFWRLTFKHFTAAVELFSKKEEVDVRPEIWHVLGDCCLLGRGTQKDISLAKKYLSAYPADLIYSNPYILLSFGMLAKEEGDFSEMKKRHEQVQKILKENAASTIKWLTPFHAVDQFLKAEINQMAPKPTTDTPQTRQNQINLN